MLLLVTLALVVASAILLILGFVQDALGFIYLSMVCAGVAALALFVFARLARRRGAALAGAGIASSPYADASHGAEPAQPAKGAARVESWYDEEDEGDDLVASDEPEEIRAAGAGARAEAEDSDLWSGPSADGDWGDEVVFPIEDYDDLRVAEILPLLSQLDPDELQEVRDRELAGKARATILDRIDDRLGRVGGPPPSAVTTAALPVVEPAGTGEPAAPGAPAWAHSGAEDAAALAEGGSVGRARSSRKAPAGRPSGTAKKTAAAKTTAARKTASPRKAAAKKAAPPAKEAAAAGAASPVEDAAASQVDSPAEEAVVAEAAAPAPAPTPTPIPAAVPARKRAASRKVAAAATEPASPSATARRAGSTRKAAAETADPATESAEKPAGAAPVKKSTGPSAAAKKAATESDAPRKAGGPAKRAPRKAE